MNRSQFDQSIFFLIFGFLVGCIADNSHYYEKMTSAEETIFYVLVGVACTLRFCFEKTGGQDA